VNFPKDIRIGLMRADDADPGGEQRDGGRERARCRRGRPARDPAPAFDCGVVSAVPVSLTFLEWPIDRVCDGDKIWIRRRTSGNRQQPLPLLIDVEGLAIRVETSTAELRTVCL
jgi:hypothetical protein